MESSKTLSLVIKLYKRIILTPSWIDQTEKASKFSCYLMQIEFKVIKHKKLFKEALLPKILFGKSAPVSDSVIPIV